MTISDLDPVEAVSIAQDVLDRNAEAIISNDLDEMCRMCTVPCRLETLDRQLVLKTAEHVKSTYKACRESLASRNITHMFRRCVKACWSDARTICALFETRYISNGQHLVSEPFLCLTTLRFVSGDWKISSMQFATDNTEPIVRTINDQR